jgi:hypothetical protein
MARVEFLLESVSMRRLEYVKAMSAESDLSARTAVLLTAAADVLMSHPPVMPRLAIHASYPLVTFFLETWDVRKKKVVA